MRFLCVLFTGLYHFLSYWLQKLGSIHRLIFLYIGCEYSRYWTPFRHHAAAWKLHADNCSWFWTSIVVSNFLVNNVPRYLNWSAVQIGPGPGAVLCSLLPAAQLVRLWKCVVVVVVVVKNTLNLDPRRSHIYDVRDASRRWLWNIELFRSRLMGPIPHSIALLLDPDGGLLSPISLSLIGSFLPNSVVACKQYGL